MKSKRVFSSIVMSIVVFLVAINITGCSTSSNDNSISNNQSSSSDNQNITQLSFLRTDDITIEIGKTEKPGYLQVKTKSNKDFSPSDVVFVSDNPDVATITFTKDALTTCLYFEVKAIGAGETSVYATAENGNVISEKILVIVPNDNEDDVTTLSSDMSSTSTTTSSNESEFENEDGIRNENLKGRGRGDEDRTEPKYEKVIGYAVVAIENYTFENDDTSLLGEWTVPVFEKKDSYNEIGTIPHKTEIIVLSQEISQVRRGEYAGYLYVRRTDNNEKFYINVENFVTKPYWEYSNLNDIARVGYCVAVFNQKSDYSPIDSRNQIFEVDDGVSVLITEYVSSKKDNTIGAVVFSGDNSINVYFNSDDLTIIY